MNAARIPVVRGLSMPFFPMRPTSGRSLDAPLLDRIYEKMDEGHTVQLKLNGDRALLLVDGAGTVHVANRYGRWFGHTVTNRDEISRTLPRLTVLDGEVFGRKFYPFEVVVYDGESLIFNSPQVREDKAKLACKLANIEWLYEPKKMVLLNLALNLPRHEGVVVKAKDSPYFPLANDKQDSVNWTKNKW